MRVPKDLVLLLFLRIQPVGQIGEIFHMAMERIWIFTSCHQNQLVCAQTKPDNVKIVLFAFCIHSMMMIPCSPYKRFITSEKQMSFAIMIVV